MTWSEGVAWFLVVLLAVYGCAQGVRRLCLWLTRCPQCVECYRLALPRERAQLAPLVRCLQCQAVWEDPVICLHTLVVLPPQTDRTDPELQKIFSEAPSVIPIMSEELPDMVRIYMETR